MLAQYVHIGTISHPKRGPEWKGRKAPQPAIQSIHQKGIRLNEYSQFPEPPCVNCFVFMLDVSNSAFASQMLFYAVSAIKEVLAD